MPATQTDVGDWIAQYSDEPEKVREFCERHGILDRVRTTIELAKKNFPPVEKLTLSLWTDPLEKTEKVYIYLTARSSYQEAREGDRRFLRDWAAALPFPQRVLIGFTYTIV